MIQTVTGPIDASELGVTMAHEHLSVDLSGVRDDEDSVFGYSSLVMGELERLKAAGANSVVEVSCIGMGRDVEELVRMSKESGLNIVCSTGFYLESYHPAWLKNMSVDEVEDLMTTELLNGIEGTDIRAGVIGEIAGEKCEITDSERKVMIAAAHASSKTGCAVTTHCQLGRMAVEQASLLLSEGVSPRKVVLGHLDLANDIEYYKRVLGMGVNIGFDTCGKVKYLADETRADNLARLVDLGYAGQIVLSADVSRKSYMSAEGGYGYSGVLERMIPMLRERGVDEKEILAMLIDNSARIFDIEDVA